MTTALQLSSVERLDGSAPAPGRAPLITLQSGPRFADLLQRGQAAHGAPARTAEPPPSQAGAAAGEGIEGERDDDTVSAPEAPGKAARAAAKPAPRGREKAPAFALAAQASPAPVPADGNTSEAASARHAADDKDSSWPPGTMPMAELHEWMASLQPPAPLPAQSGLAAAQGAAATADGAAVLRPASGVDALGAADGTAVRRPAASAPVARPSDDASALASTNDATVPRPTRGATMPRPADDATPRRPADAAALLRSEDGAKLPRPVDGAPVLRRDDGADLLRPADAAAVPRPTASTVLPRPADAAAALRPADGTALLRSVDGSAVRSAAEGAPQPRPAAGAGNGPRPQHGAAATDDPRRHGDDSISATQGARPTAPSPDPAAPLSGERRPAAPDLPAVRDLVQGLLSGAAGAVPRGFDAATLAPITLPTPVHSPEFAQVLGAQVSVLARDGVQQAELHLHPAEMGPISVHIRIDDKDARVEFHVDAAATREAIERGLPELASALREQGLTLAGGGVFQQPPDPHGPAQREPGGDAGPSRRFASVPDESVARPLATPLPQGTLDVYA